MPMEFYDASTHSDEQRTWVRPDQPKSIPKPSIFLTVLSTILITFSLIAVAGNVVEIVLDGRPLAIFVSSIAIVWFGILALFQYVGVFQRSYVTSSIALFQTAMMIVFWTLLGLTVVLRYEQEIWMAIAICTAGIPPALLCLLQFDWIQRLSAYYRQEDRAAAPQVTLRQLFVFLLIVAIVLGTATAYHQVRLRVPLNKPYMDGASNYSLW
ncbi:hypothetical protein [Blastopirellula marina]|uniref:Uncharacterized protein n=1 Tax=Blastopirellula marina TaxID=124 RepID=A0A2S8F6R8_9BACT|nr:hypothetical protein [Blastopirellula marina]PQO27845.1 hypothetical protein C5Y98_26310 [Blastopirellula marina]PTL41580.1 hypothetical protein C5Y97_26325 [Blastopirellula marina]